MGEAADDMVEGFACHVCGEMIDGESPGYERTCAGCDVGSESDSEPDDDEDDA